MVIVGSNYPVANNLFYREGARMKIRLMIVALVVCAIICGGYTGLYAEVAWQETNTWKVDGQPLQVSHSKDGKWTYVLTDNGNISVYSKKGELQGKIPVAPNYRGRYDWQFWHQFG